MRSRQEQDGSRIGNDPLQPAVQIICGFSQNLLGDKAAQAVTDEEKRPLTQAARVEALRLAKESLAIDERLAALDRSNATWQQDVAFSRALVARPGGKTLT